MPPSKSRGDKDGRDRIKRLNARIRKKKWLIRMTADDHYARRRINIGPQMPGIRLQGQGIRFFAHREKLPGDKIIDDGETRTSPQRLTGRFHDLRGHQLADSSKMIPNAAIKIKAASMKRKWHRLCRGRRMEIVGGRCEVLTEKRTIAAASRIHPRIRSHSG